MKQRLSLNSVLVEGRAFVALVLIIVIFTSLSPLFLEPANLVVMTRHVAINAILAMGMLLVILNGGIDLSIGSIAGLSGVVAGALLSGLNLTFAEMIAYPPAWAVIVIALAGGTLLGLINGLVIAKLRVAPFIATLGMLYIARGAALLITNGAPYSSLEGTPANGNTGFLTVLKAAPLGLPIAIWVMVILAIAFVVLLRNFPFGRWLYASGGNERAAELSGIPTQAVKIWVYVLSGFCAGVVGLLLAGDLSSATPQAGQFYELNAIAAVVIGGAALSGGRGTIRGALVGAFVIGFLVDGLVLVGVSDFWQQIIKGAVIIFAVALDQFQQRMETRRAASNAAASLRPNSTKITAAPAEQPQPASTDAR